ncbi:MAG TPA: PilX N-terminal domain-containing pilus assembly protein [Gammaproteobacteria bacterium]|nr:PilX N-terminal domain-containing pilus assembly protein [Gammaproteobacteria bacterium]
MIRARPQLFRRERGAALIIALVFLIVLTMLGVSSMRTTTLQQRMAGNQRDSNLAFQAAEAGLREAEQFLRQAALPRFVGNDGLLQRQDNGGLASFWRTYDWDTGSVTAAAVPGVAEPPRYVIEELPPVQAKGDSLRFGAMPEPEFYRVTSRAVGGSTDTVSILQVTYRR